MSEEKIDAYTVYASTDYVDEKIANVNSVKDWNINDENDPAYIKNRTHWTEPAILDLLPEAVTLNIEGEWSYEGIDGVGENNLAENDRVVITFDGVDYECTVLPGYPGAGWLGMGNHKGMNEDADYIGNGEPLPM